MDIFYFTTKIGKYNVQKRYSRILVNQVYTPWTDEHVHFSHVQMSIAFKMLHPWRNVCPYIMMCICKFMDGQNADRRLAIIG